jgi:hypothetical protein
MNGVQKAYQDWLAGCNVIKVTESGTFTINPLESACDGPQLLQIPFPQPRAYGNAGILTSYYLELRAPVGYRDRKLSPQVLVMVANDVREARFTGNNNWLLDMTPETKKLGDEGLPVGKPFQDALPGGPKFTLLSVDATRAVIQVELAGKPGEAGKPGKAVCSDSTEYNPAAAAQCVAPATPASPPPPASDGGAGDGGAAGQDALAEPTPSGPVVQTDAGSPGGAGRGPDAASGAGGPGDPPPLTEAPRGSSGGCQVAPGGRPAGASSLVLLSVLTSLALLALLTFARRSGRLCARARIR